MSAFSPHVGAEIDPEMLAGAACEQFGIKLEDIMDELRARQQMRAQVMRRRMALAQRAGGVRKILRKGGLDAYVDIMIDPISYHYWGRRLGYECWDNKAFLREYKRDNPESRVRLRGTPGLETLAMRWNKAPAARAAAVANASTRAARPRITGRGRWSR